MNKSSIRKLTLTGLLSAVAFVLYFIEFPIPFFPTFLKIDLADIPAIIAAFSMGPISGVAVELIKNIFGFLTKTTTGGIGEMANFTCGTVLVLIAGGVYMINKSIKSAIIGLLIGALTMALTMSIINYYVFIPMFYPEMPMDQVLTLIKTAIFPFNLIKGIIIGLISIFTFKGLYPIINKFANEQNEVDSDLQ